MGEKEIKEVANTKVQEQNEDNIGYGETFETDINNSISEPILSENIFNYSEKDKDELKHLLNLYERSERQQRILKGSVVSVNTVRDDEGGKTVYFVIKLLDADNSFLNVQIPFDEFFMDYPLEDDKGDLLDIIRRKEQFARNYIGARISLIVSKIENKEQLLEGICIVYASRKAADKMMQDANFRGMYGVKETFKEGDKVKAQIISVGTYGIIVSFAGVDVSMRRKALTFQYIKNVAESYTVGEEIEAIINKITDVDGQIKVELNVTTLELEKSKVALNCLFTTNKSINVIAVGTISSIEEKDGRYVIYSFLNEYQIPVIAYISTSRFNGVQLERGSKVRLRLTGRNDGFAFATIMGVIPAKDDIGSSSTPWYV